MSQLKSGFTLSADEELVMELEAELWAASSNPVAKLLGDIQRFIAMILGFKMRGFVIITNKRVIEVGTQIACYVFTVGRQVKYVLPSSVKETGYNRKAACAIFCPAYYFYYEAHTQKTEVMLKGADEAEALRVTNVFYDIIAKANAK